MPALFTKCLAAVFHQSTCAIQKKPVAPNSPTTEEIRHPGISELGKEDPVDWDFWLTPEALSGEGPPPSWMM